MQRDAISPAADFGWNKSLTKSLDGNRYNRAGCRGCEVQEEVPLYPACAIEEAHDLVDTLKANGGSRNARILTS